MGLLNQVFKDYDRLQDDNEYLREMVRQLSEENVMLKEECDSCAEKNQELAESLQFYEDNADNLFEQFHNQESELVKARDMKIRELEDEILEMEDIFYFMIKKLQKFEANCL